jgi:Signal transduction histidine kinase regulating citrate/malate metabolism
MSQTAAMVFNTALILLEDCMMLIFANGFFVKKRMSLFSGLIFTLVVLLSCVFLYFVEDISILRVSFISVLFSLWIVLCYKASLLKAVFSVLFWQAYLLIGDTGILLLISTIMGKSLPDLMTSPDSYYFLCISVKIAELLGITLFQTWLKRHLMHACITISEWLRVMIFPIATLLISVYLLRIYSVYPALSWELTVCNAILLVVDIVSVFLLNHLEKQHKAARDNIILRQSMKTQLDNVDAWRKAYEGQRKQTHDFQNQLLVIHGLVEHQAPKDEILEYIGRLQSIDSISTLVVQTHRTAVDIILNQKYAIAESRSIRFVTQLDDLSGFPLQDDALIVVLSNLIDNAIEACEQIKDVQKRYISLKMKVEPQASFLHIENPTASPVVIQSNKIVSTKKNPVEHGFGLQNVMAVLDQSNAIYLVDYNANSRIFSFSAQISAD